jgi:hypothetical protein
MLPTKKSPKISDFFYCNTCDYKCSKKSEFNKHLLTNKHKILQNPTYDNNDVKMYNCKCGKKYKHSSTLYAHKKICNYIETIDEHIEDNHNSNKSDEPSDKDLIMLLIKENSELKTLMMEQSNMMMKVIENGTHNTTNNNNSHNKAFNLQFFLNETCKDAMNIMDFVDSIKLQLSDLERVGELGYVEGISSIIVKNLKELDVTQRPIHCTDKKRETIYIKDENQWEKDEEKKKMHKLVRKVADKNARMIPKYKEVNPDYRLSTSKCSDQYNKIIVESFDNDYEKEEKIIKKVTKEVIVEKEASSL